LQQLPKEQQEAYTRKVEDTYRRLADLLLSQGRVLEAQGVLELLKIQELRDFTRNAGAGGGTSGIATNPTETEILKIHGTLIALGRQIEECQKTQCEQKSKLLDEREVIAKQFEATVRSLEQEIRSSRANDKGFLDPSTLGGNAEDIVAAQPGTVLVYPLVLKDKLWILWAAKGGITNSIEVPQVGLKQLSGTVLKFRQLLQKPSSNVAELKATGKQLYDWLIPQSLQRELKENHIQNLVFSLDHVTRYIPMGAVFDGKNYLIENYNISTIISANLTRMGDRLPPGTQNTSVLAAGLSNAIAGFNSLPNVPAELDAIVRQSTTDSQGIYSGLKLLNQAFDRKALLDNLAGHQILHIATHGQFVPGNGYDSYLLLGDGKKLPIPEVQSLRDLNKIHLVVLSACETALGDTGQDGTEIAGLSYYFLNGGAKAVIASLWAVNDESTSLLMKQFYSNLAKSTTESPISKAQALRQAQLSLIHGNQTSTANANSRSIIEVQPRSEGQSAAITAPEFPSLLLGTLHSDWQ
jgi:CHAT domain-containing protein